MSGWKLIVCKPHIWHIWTNAMRPQFWPIEIFFYKFGHILINLDPFEPIGQYLGEIGISYQPLWTNGGPFWPIKPLSDRYESLKIHVDQWRPILTNWHHFWPIITNFYQYGPILPIRIHFDQSGQPSINGIQFRPSRSHWDQPG